MVLGCASQPTQPTVRPYVILVSIDGYRFDYTQRLHPSHIEALANAGLQATSLTLFITVWFRTNFMIQTFAPLTVSEIFGRWAMVGGTRAFHFGI